MDALALAALGFPLPSRAELKAHSADALAALGLHTTTDTEEN